MDERRARIGRNEALFREVNERLKEVGESFTLVSDSATFVCECGVVSCVEPIQLSLEDYERIRSEPTWFFVKPGHVEEDVERVVGRGDGYEIVEKHPGGPADLARSEDPRH